MIEVEQEQNQKVKVLLIGEPDVSLAELEGLCQTAGYEILRSVNLNRMEENPVYGIPFGESDEFEEF